MRKISLMAVVAVLAVVGLGCSTKDDPSEGAAGTSTSTTSSANRSGTTDESGSGDAAASPAEQCQAVLVLMGGLSVGGALPEGDARDELEQQIADARQKVPAELQDDIDTIGDGVQDADGIVEWGKFVASQEYRDAIGNLQQYLTDNCDAGDLLPN